MTTTHYRYETIQTSDLRATDLREEAADLMARGAAVEAARVFFEGQAEAAEVLYIPEAGRAGLVWGGDAEWTDASSIEDAVQRYLDGEMIP